MHVHNPTHISPKVLYTHTHQTAKSKAYDQFQRHQTQPQQIATYQNLAKQSRIQNVQSASRSQDQSFANLSPSSQSASQSELTEDIPITPTIRTYHDPALHNAQQIVKQNPLERKARAQLHRSHWLDRAITAPRSPLN